MTRLKWNLILVCLEILFVSVQDRCTVCSERTIGSEIFWTCPIELLNDMGHVESRFGSFQDGVSVGAKNVHGLR